MAWKIVFERKAERELLKVGKPDRARILAFLEKRLAGRSDPRELGAALAGEWSGYWKYRVGDYRLIAKIEDSIVTIIVVTIGHRREIYR